MNLPLISQLLGLLFYYGNCVVIDTKQGKLKGGIEHSRGGRPFYSFYGIPYAEPPIGDLRFQNPVLPKSWEGIRDATVLPPPCISVEDEGKIHGKEDCLYLNLYTPKLKNDFPLPVMVFIYGGRFMYGHALPDRYGAHYFMDKDVIIITFQYRLGIFGFLSTEDDVISGNYGLKDVVAVLQWVRNYVDSFGGDNNRVTVFGGSSGGVSAASMLISPLAKGLFHRVISQSGVMLDTSKVGEASRGTWKIASLVGCDDSTESASLLSCLRKLPAEELVKHNFELYTFGHMEPVLPWGPVIENENLPGAFLVDNPRKLYQRKSNIPWIIGMNSGDGAIFAIFAYFNSYLKVIDEIAENYHKYFPIVLNYVNRYTNDPEKWNEITEILKKHYFGDSEIRENPQAFAKMNTDHLYLLAINESVSMYNGPLYVYYYDHKNNQTFAHMYGDFEEEMGVIHGDELISIFNWSAIITPITEGIDLVVSQQMVELWTNFAAKGDPNGDGEVIWKPLQKLNYLFIKDGLLKPGDHLLKEDLDFLQSIKDNFS